MNGLSHHSTVIQQVRSLAKAAKAARPPRRVFEVNGSSLGVSASPIVQDLKEQVEHLKARPRLNRPGTYGDGSEYPPVTNMTDI